MTDQLARDPSLVGLSAYHDRIAGDINNVDLLPTLFEWQIGVFESEILDDDIAAVMDWQADKLDFLIVRRTA